MNKKVISFCLTLIIISSSLVGCGKETTTNYNILNNQSEIIELEPTPTEEPQKYQYNTTINVSGTDLVMYDTYETTFYNTKIDFVDIDFLNYKFGISLPQMLFDPNNLYYLEEDENGSVLLKTDDANKTILNFMDDIHYTLFNYSCGIFSTWSYTIDKTTYKNLMYSTPEEILYLLQNEEEISYKNGYSFEKHFDNKEEDAYRIIMEIDYYPFTTESSSLFYHGYLVLLVHDKDVRVITFAEPKIDANFPYQMGYPIVNSCYWLDIPKINYLENEDLEEFIKNTPTPTPIEENTNENEENNKEDNKQSFSSIALTPEPTPTMSLSETITKNP